MLVSAELASGLTARQRSAVAHRESNVLLEAVPGSGKTRVIVARCVSLVAGGVDASRILLLTFSRRAVAELRTRLATELPPQAVPAVYTFHGFAAHLLAAAGAGGHSSRLLAEPAERALFERVVQAARLPSLPPDTGRSPMFCQDASLRVDELRRSSADALDRLRARSTPRIDDLLHLVAEQDALRDRLGVADYDDLVARSVRLISGSGGAAQRLQERYAHILVDEFQDTDMLQLALLEQLGRAAEIFAVGDAAQAIYGFRGAARNALARAQAALRMTKLPLDESFRCPANICDLARSVLPAAPVVQSRVERGGEIEFRRAASPADEAAYIADVIASAVLAGTSPAQIAVLVRSVEPLARLMDGSLAARGISVVRQGGERILDDLGVDAMCAALRAFCDPADSRRWRELLGHPVFGIPALALRLQFDARPARSGDEACDVIEALPLTARAAAQRIATALRSARTSWESCDPVRAARAFGYDANVLGFIAAADESAARRSGRRIERFLKALADVQDVCVRLDPQATAGQIVETFFACSVNWNDGADAVATDAGVRLLTIHAAKGLEFELVVIADAVEDRFPQRARADTLLTLDELATARECGVDLGTHGDEALSEERSLWYVAVTRAKRRVVVTWSETGIDGSPQRPSRFVPLAERLLETTRPSFRGPLEYTAAPALQLPQAPRAARLQRPLPTASVENWLVCRRKFYYDTLLHLRGNERGFKAELGKLVHQAIEEFHTSVHDLTEIGAGIHHHWTTTLLEIAHTIAAQRGDSAGFASVLENVAAMRVVERLLARYARVLEQTALDAGFNVVGCEEYVRYEVDGITFSGRIDRIDRLADGSLALVDVKTGAFKRDKAMTVSFEKLASVVDSQALWCKETPLPNPQLALYRHAKAATSAVSYVYLGARPKADEFKDAAHVDRLDITAGAASLETLDNTLHTTFFEPWNAGAVDWLAPTRNARACRRCDFAGVCPGYLEDEQT